MKILAVATGALAAPGLATAACQHSTQTEQVANAALRGTGLVVSFTDEPAIGGARTVIVTNTSDTTVKLTSVYPGVVSTPQGSYDLNSMLANGPREFLPKQATTLSIEPVKTAAAEYPSPTAPSSDNWISVRTRNARTNGDQHVTTVRHNYA